MAHDGERPQADEQQAPRRLLPRTFKGYSRCYVCQQVSSNQEWLDLGWRCPTPGCRGEVEDMQPVVV